MKTAKQQAQELDQTSNFLNSLLSADHKDEKVQLNQTDNASSRLVNGKPKLPRIDPASRFSDPPAPPPQQPLPEKPDLARSSPSDTAMVSSFKRSDTARPGSGMGGSPTSQQSSQILSLVEALNSAKKELESQGTRVKHLEDMLRQERSARESAEERARRLEQSVSFKPFSNAEQEQAEPNGSDSVSGDASTEQPSEGTNAQGTTHDALLPEGDASTQVTLQSRVNQVVAEMEKMREEMQKFQQRAEAAEADATSTRTNLAEMIQRLKAENKDAAEADKYGILPSESELQLSQSSKNAEEGKTSPSTAKSLSKQTSNMPNGHIRAPSKLPENLERAMATVLKTDGDGQLLAQSAPYASMLGVILIGVGLMAYLNSWQKIEK